MGGTLGCSDGARSHNRDALAGGIHGYPDGEPARCCQQWRWPPLVWFPTERLTRVGKLALFLTGLYLASSVHLSLIVRKRHMPGQVPSLTNCLRRFLDNPRVGARNYYCLHTLVNH
jgi:hypothetical protein